MNEIEIALKLFNQRCEIEKDLYTLGIVRSHRFVADFGEWLACKLFNCTLSQNPNEMYWDIETKVMRYQVKTYHKATSNRSSFSEIRSVEYPVIIIRLNQNYTIKNLYFISAQKLIELNNRGDLTQQVDGYKLKWSQCEIINEQFQNIYPFLFQ